MRSSIWTTCMTAVVSALLVSGCGDSTGVRTDGSVRVEALPGFIRVENTLAEPIYSFVVGRERAAAINWAACVRESACGEILPGRDVTVADPNADRTQGTAREREALVYWWVAVRNGSDARVAGPINSLIVELR